MFLSTKHKIISLLFLIIAGFAFGQTLPDVATAGYNRLKDIRKELNKTITDLSKISDTATMHENGDTIIFIANHQLDAVKITYVFNEEYDEKYCSTQTYEFSCTPCANNHLSDVIKKYGFKKLSDNKYLSAYYMQTQLEVVVTNSNKQCLTLVFTHVNKPKKQYKQLYKTLAKN